MVRGATAKGLEGSIPEVLTRKSRRHYGTSFAEPFSRRKHRNVDAFIDEYDGWKKADNQMKWLIKKGQDMHTSKAKHASVSLSMTYWPDESMETECELLACENDVAPQRATDAVS